MRADEAPPNVCIPGGATFGPRHRADEGHDLWRWFHVDQRHGTLERRERESESAGPPEATANGSLL